MKKAFSLFGIVFLALASVIAGQASNSDIESVLAGFFKEILMLNSELAAQLGVDKAMGITVAHANLTDVSDAAIDREYDLYRRYRNQVAAFDPDRLTPGQRLNREILLWYLDDQLAGEPFRYHGYLVNSMFGVHNSLTTLMTEYHPLATIQDAHDYITRLEKYNLKFSQLLTALKTREQKGLMPPQDIIKKTTDIMKEFIQSPPAENVLFTHFKTGLLKLSEIDPFAKVALYRQAQDAIATVVYPAYEKMIRYLNELQPRASDTAGVWQLPDGDSYYRYCLRSHTSTSMTPDQIHKLGLQEVARIQKAARRILTGLGIAENANFGAMMQQYWRSLNPADQDRFFYSAAPTARKQALADYQTLIDRIERRLPELFSLLPQTSVQVQPVPEFKQATMNSNYLPATLDGKRPGTFYVNLLNLPFKPDMMTLACHEAVPGHHFQIALQQESPENRPFRNLFIFTGYVEGWALYAEKLAYENGWFDDPHSRLGYLRSELFRAARLVLDTGIHYKRWSRAQAYTYMVANLGWASESELDRYIVWPGQACAYKVGELKILALRQNAQKKLGRKFDLRAFHRSVLEPGAVPLDLLERWVTEDIRRNSGAGRGE